MDKSVSVEWIDQYFVQSIAVCCQQSVRAMKQIGRRDGS